jgi:hypothetical protein
MTDSTVPLEMKPSVTPPPLPVPDADGLRALDLLLRDRAAFLARLDDPGDRARLAKVLLMTSFLAAAAFGATLGAAHGGLQIMASALKLPVVVLLTAALTAPALSALHQAVAGRNDTGRELALVLAALTFGLLVAAALAPVVLLAEVAGVEYHRLVVLVVACCAVGGGSGFSLLLQGLSKPGTTDGRLVGLLFIAVVALVGSQLSWTLRPWLVRPQTVDAPFVRALEGSFLDALSLTADSARGRYAPAGEGR